MILIRHINELETLALVPRLPRPNNKQKWVKLLALPYSRWKQMRANSFTLRVND